MYPGGASGVLLKSNGILIDVYGDLLGLRLDCLNKFNVNIHFLIRGENKCIGEFGSVLKNPEMKWFFQVRIYISDAFLLCTPGGTIWTYNPWLLLYFFM